MHALHTHAHTHTHQTHVVKIVLRLGEKLQLIALTLGLLFIIT